MKKTSTFKQSEDNLQKVVARWLDYSGYLWFHPANGGSRNIIEASKFKAMGVKAGVPDIVICQSSGLFHALFIELKVGKNKLTSTQIAWHGKLRQNRYFVAVCYSFDEVKLTVENYFGK